MPIPDFQAIMLPLLKLTSDKQEHRVSDLVEILATQFKLTDNENKALLPSGQTFIFGSRVSWARTYLKKAGVLISQKRASVSITERGLYLLEQNPAKVDSNLLRQFPEFLAFQNSKKNEKMGNETTVDVNSTQTPEETLENSYQSIRKNLAQELRKRVIELPPIFFEKLVVELLVKMGYGGSLQDAGQATRLTNDEGIDGIIKEDKLGLDFIYIQAKRWNNQAVGRPDIQSFVGALDGQKANKGIFITTSRFAENAKEYVKTITKKVILVDGNQLAEFMIDYNLGVSTSIVYEVKRIDSDYFGEN